MHKQEIISHLYANQKATVCVSDTSLCEATESANQDSIEALQAQLAHQQHIAKTMMQELVAKNSLLFEIRKRVHFISQYTTQEGIPVAEQLLDKIDRNLVPLENKFELDKQWSDVHAEYIQLLQHCYPSLTSMECKIATLLKMRLSSANISAVMFLSKRTVEFHRLNIRKKLGLCKDDVIHLALQESVLFQRMFATADGI